MRESRIALARSYSGSLRSAFCARIVRRSTRAVQRTCSAYDAGTANVRRLHSGFAARSRRPRSRAAFDEETMRADCAQAARRHPRTRAAAAIAERNQVRVQVDAGDTPGQRQQLAAAWPGRRRDRDGTGRDRRWPLAARDAVGRLGWSRSRTAACSSRACRRGRRPARRAGRAACDEKGARVYYNSELPCPILRFRV